MPAVLQDRDRIQYNRKEFKDYELDTTSKFVHRDWTKVEDLADESGI